MRRRKLFLKKARKMRKSKKSQITLAGGKTSKLLVHKCNCPMTQIISGKNYWHEEAFTCFAVSLWMFYFSRVRATGILIFSIKYEIFNCYKLIKDMIVHKQE